MDMVLTIAKDIRVEQVIQKSRFLCTLKKVATEDEAQAFLRDIKKQFWDATHNCSAYVLDETLQRSSDDGEPSGTAGVPMLHVLRQQGLTGVAAVVTRYFGGIKLGAGGLVRAYSSSVAKAVAAAGIVQRVAVGTYTFSCGADEAGKWLHVLYGQDRFPVTDVSYGSRVTIALSFPESLAAEAEAWLTNTFRQPVSLEQQGRSFAEIPWTGEKNI
jgi:uncharacterized YigZ family protein